MHFPDDITSTRPLNGHNKHETTHNTRFSQRFTQKHRSAILERFGSTSSSAAPATNNTLPDQSRPRTLSNTLKRNADTAAPRRSSRRTRALPRENPASQSSSSTSVNSTAEGNDGPRLQRGFKKMRSMFLRASTRETTPMVWSQIPPSHPEYNASSSSSPQNAVARPLSSSDSAHGAATVTPGAYLHVVPQQEEEETIASSTIQPTIERSPSPFPDNASYIPPSMYNFQPPTGGSAARAAAASANSRKKVERKDSQTLVTPPRDDVYGRENRESGIVMSAEHSRVRGLRSRALSQVKGKNPLEVLPAEISAQIFSHLNAHTLAQVAQVAPAWYELTMDSHVWKHVFLKTWQAAERSNPLPLMVGGKGIGSQEGFNQHWAAMHRARKQINTNWSKGDAMAIYLNGHTDSVYCVQFDENYIYTGSRDRTIRVWDIRTYECLRVIGIPEALANDRMHRAHPNPNNAQPEFPEGTQVKLNLPGEPQPEIYHTPSMYHDASILCMQLDDEIAITGSSDNTLIIWDLKTWQPLKRLEHHSAGVLDVAFDKEKIVSCSKDSTLCIWDRETGKLLQKVDSHRGPVNAVQLRGQLVISASGEGCARLWNVGYERRFNPYNGQYEATADTKLVKEFWSHERGLACIEFSDDGKYVLAGGNDMMIFKYDAHTGIEFPRMTGHTALVRSLYLDEASGRIISGSYDSSIRVWDLHTGEQTMCFPAWTTSWMLSAKSDYRRIVCTGQDSRALILDFGYGVEDAELLEC